MFLIGPEIACWITLYFIYCFTFPICWTIAAKYYYPIRIYREMVSRNWQIWHWILTGHFKFSFGTKIVNFRWTSLAETERQFHQEAYIKFLLSQVQNRYFFSEKLLVYDLFAAYWLKKRFISNLSTRKGTTERARERQLILQSMAWLWFPLCILLSC